jgi:hypothetical protein
MYSLKLVIACTLLILAAHGASASDPFSSVEAARNIGKTGAVCATVAQARYLPSVTGQPTFLNCNGPYRSPSHDFTFVILGNAHQNYNPEPEKLRGCVCGVGSISIYESIQQIQNPNPLYEARTPEEQAKCR